MMTYSKTPWRTGGKHNAIVYDADGQPVANATTYNGVESEQMTANASYIARSVNSHRDLVLALCEARRFILDLGVNLSDRFGPDEMQEANAVDCIISDALDMADGATVKNFLTVGEVTA